MQFKLVYLTLFRIAPRFSTFPFQMCAMCERPVGATTVIVFIRTAS